MNNEISAESVEARRKKIIEALTKNGKVRVADLGQQFSISEVTIRNDLTELEKAGLLERVHGGAISSNKAYYNMSFIERITKYETEKRAVAAAAAAKINPGDTVMINSGTTTLFVAQELKNLSSLTIVTNSAVIAQELAPLQQFNVIMLGGNYNAQYQFTYGDDALQQLCRYKTDKLILSADGVSFSHGLSTHHHQEAEVSRIMLERVGQTIVVADFSKIGRENFAHIAPIRAVDVLITNDKADSGEIESISQAVPEVIQI